MEKGTAGVDPINLKWYILCAITHSFRYSDGACDKSPLDLGTK